MSSLLFKPIPHFHSPSLENNSWHLFRSSKTEELKAGCIDTESPLLSQSQFQKFLTHLLFVKHPWWRHWAGQLLKHNWGCCRCRQGFPGARHTALLSCPYNTILGLYLDADTHTTTTVAPRIPTIPSQPNPTAPPSWALAIFRPLWVSSSYYWQGRINQTQYLQTHNSFCISSVAPDQANVLIDPHFWPSGSSSFSANGTFVAFAASPTFGL